MSEHRGEDEPLDYGKPAQTSGRVSQRISIYASLRILLRVCGRRTEDSRRKQRQDVWRTGTRRSRFRCTTATLIRNFVLNGHFALRHDDVTVGRKPARTVYNIGSANQLQRSVSKRRRLHFSGAPPKGANWRRLERWRIHSVDPKRTVLCDIERDNNNRRDAACYPPVPQKLRRNLIGIFSKAPGLGSLAPPA